MEAVMEEKNPNEIWKEGEENIKKFASDVDKRMKDNPWPFLAGVAVVSLFRGFLMGKGTKA